MSLAQQDPSIGIANVPRFASDLIDTLVDGGPATAVELCSTLGWPRGRLDSALRYAREELCPELKLAIPHPTPMDGWRYQITDQWEPVEAGASHALGSVETRLFSILRDVETIYPHLTKGSTEWRRATFLRKHLGHITSTLKEINDGEG